MRREYYIHKRKNGVFYVEFASPENGKKLSARSTGETDRVKAQAKAEFWLLSGVPTGRLKKPRPLLEAAGIEAVIRAIRKSELNSDDALRIVSALKSMGLIDIAAVKDTGRGAAPFIQFLETFWNYDGSPYIRDKLAHGYRFSRHYARECQKRLAKDIKPFFGGKKLNCVTTDDLKDLSNLLAGRGLATSTINQTVLICTTALKWAFNEKIIPANPAAGLTRFSVTNKERGVLTEAEAAAVFSAVWKDKRAFTASLVAVTTGARQGECLALRRSDIGGDTINIAHSYSQVDGLKLPKNNRKRIVPLLPEVRAALLDLLKDNPYESGDPYIFYSARPDKPTDPQVVLEGLKDALRQTGVDYKGRNICFHSWRHYFCSKITEIIDGEKAAKVSGHLSEAVFRKYADHIEAKNIQDVGNAAAKAFGNVLQFRKVG
ncbi:MAG: tyrosine-type recombinase/integrase [Treponema sp.]|jgi:integrase|nr:tyrosine-type recombinase/integrase [Treponema sp.]